MTGRVSGAVLGLLFGLSLSTYAGLLDARRRAAGERTEAEYRFSLLGVPVFLAVVGGLVGEVIAH